MGFRILIAATMVLFCGVQAWADTQRTNREINNPVNNGDMLLQVKKAGVKVDSLRIEGSTGSVFVQAPAGTASFTTVSQSANGYAYIMADAHGTGNPEFVFKNTGTHLASIRGLSGGGLQFINQSYLQINGALNNSGAWTLGPSGFVSAHTINGNMVFPAGYVDITRSGTGILLNNSLNSGTTYAMRIDLSGSTNMTGAHYIRFGDSDTFPTGSIAAASATTIAFNTSSDKRLKKDIKPFKNGIDLVKKGAPSCYRWKEDNHFDCGFIAQDMKKIYPFAVTGSPDSNLEENPMGIDYGKLTTVLWAAVKEQQQIIEKLQKDIAELKNEN